MTSKPYALFVSLMLLVLTHSVSGNLVNEQPGRNAALSANCSHVGLLSRNSPKLDEKVPLKYRASVIIPGPNQTDVARMALDALPPFVCKAVNHIVFINQKNGDALAFVNRDFPATIIVIAAQGLASEEKLKGSNMPSFEDQDASTVITTKLAVWPQTVKSIIHEAIHCAANLLESVNDAPGIEAHNYKPVWSSDATTNAKRIISDNLLKLDLLNDWKRINLQFADHEWSQHYPSEDASVNVLEDPSQKPPTGFMSLYGSKSAAEDVAELAAWPIFMVAYEDKKTIRLGNMPNLEIGTFVDFGDNANLVPSWNYVNACKDLSATTSKGIPGNLAAVYLKLNFLLDLEIITREAFEKCIGGGKIGLQTNSDSVSGFQTFVGPSGEFSREYSRDVRTTTSGVRFIAAAKGRIFWIKEYEADIHLSVNAEASNGGMPRGVWKIENPCFAFTSLVATLKEARFFVFLPETNAHFLYACDAFVLVLRSTKKRTEGSVVMLKYFKFLVPEVPKDPIVFTFVLEK